jgi:hypothetical protein
MGLGLQIDVHQLLVDVGVGRALKQTRISEAESVGLRHTGWPVLWQFVLGGIQGGGPVRRDGTRRFNRANDQRDGRSPACFNRCGLENWTGLQPALQPKALRRSPQADSQRRHISAQMRQCSCIPAWPSHSVAQLPQATLHASSTARVMFAS